VLMLVDKLK